MDSCSQGVLYEVQPTTIPLNNLQIETGALTKVFE